MAAGVCAAPGVCEDGKQASALVRAAAQVGAAPRIVRPWIESSWVAAAAGVVEAQVQALVVASRCAGSVWAAKTAKTLVAAQVSD